jgi:hypothetical protein
MWRGMAQNYVHKQTSLLERLQRSSSVINLGLFISYLLK